MGDERHDGGRFQVGQEVADDGRFVRQRSAFRDWVGGDPGSRYPVEPGRYHLYVCLACPWSHRTVIVRRLMGLEDAVSMSLADPYRNERGWAFSGGRYTDQANGFVFLNEAYRASDPSYDGRVTVPCCGTG